MENLKTMEGKIKAILKKDEETRDDDMLLYLKVCNAYLKGAGAMPLAEVMTQYKYLGFSMTQAVTYERETKSVAFQGKIIVLESLTPVLPPKEKAQRKKEIERCLYEVFRKYGDRFP